MIISSSHPRSESLRIREKLIQGLKMGLTHQAGLLAHGRGEAFDYLLGEKTQRFAYKAIEAAAAYLLLAKHPVISINGNTSALCGKELVQLAKLLNSKVEVNLFHYSKKRVMTIENYLAKFDPDVVLRNIKSPKKIFPNIASKRKIMLQEGIGSADVVFIPLEDGDRTEVLIKSGKKVITVDLNPLSRTAQKATVTIIDNITRSIPLLIFHVKNMRSTEPENKLKQIIYNYQNNKILSAASDMIRNKI